MKTPSQNNVDKKFHPSANRLPFQQSQLCSSNHHSIQYHLFWVNPDDSVLYHVLKFFRWIQLRWCRREKVWMKLTSAWIAIYHNLLELSVLSTTIDQLRFTSVKCARSWRVFEEARIGLVCELWFLWDFVKKYFCNNKRFFDTNSISLDSKSCTNRFLRSLRVFSLLFTNFYQISNNFFLY
jgi:hypothetical protein